MSGGDWFGRQVELALRDIAEWPESMRKNMKMAGGEISVPKRHSGTDRSSGKDKGLVGDVHVMMKKSNRA